MTCRPVALSSLRSRVSIATAWQHPIFDWPVGLTVGGSVPGRGASVALGGGGTGSIGGLDGVRAIRLAAPPLADQPAGGPGGIGGDIVEGGEGIVGALVSGLWATARSARGLAREMCRPLANGRLVQTGQRFLASDQETARSREDHREWRAWQYRRCRLDQPDGRRSRVGYLTSVAHTTSAGLRRRSR